MKRSKFLRDLIATGITQGVLLLSSMFLLKIMATALSKQYFGIYMVIVKIATVGVPLTTLGLTVGIVRYVAYKREKEREFLLVGLITSVCVSFLLLLGFFVLDEPLGRLFFKTVQNRGFLLLAIFFTFGNALFSLSYSFFRGRQEILKANRMQLLFSAFPVVLSAVLWKIFVNDYSTMVRLYFILISLCGIGLGLGHVRSIGLIGACSNLRHEAQGIKRFLVYSVSRVPAGLFYALTFSVPVFAASRYLSLVAAGYLGIVVAVVRLTELLVVPFDVLFLPKFAEAKGRHDSQEIDHKTFVVVEFILTALPFLAALLYGLSRCVVVIWFGVTYVDVVPIVSLIALFSAFYVAYVLTRGILDGLFTYPYKNVICLVGFLTVLICSFFLHRNLYELGLGFGVGLLTMGITSTCILARKAKVPLPINGFLLSLLLAVLTFLGLFLFDKWVTEFCFGDRWFKLLILLVGRASILVILFLCYWRPRTLWAKELLCRVR